MPVDPQYSAEIQSTRDMAASSGRISRRLLWVSLLFSSLLFSSLVNERTSTKPGFEIIGARAGGLFPEMQINMPLDPPGCRQLAISRHELSHSIRWPNFTTVVMGVLIISLLLIDGGNGRRTGKRSVAESYSGHPDRHFSVQINTNLRGFLIEDSSRRFTGPRIDGDTFHGKR